MTKYDAIKCLKSLLDVRNKYCYMQTVSDEIKALDMAIKALEQEPKTGHWLNVNRMFVNNDKQIIHEMHCSNCKGIAYFRASYGTLVGAKICPNCGAKMEVKE